MSYVSRIWDIFMIEGRKILYRAGLAILFFMQEKLLASNDMIKIDSLLKNAETHLPKICTEDEFIKQCCSYTFGKKEMYKWENDYIYNNKQDSIKKSDSSGESPPKK
jgi:hypothetical protein